MQIFSFPLEINTSPQTLSSGAGRQDLHLKWVQESERELQRKWIVTTLLILIKKIYG